ncbi:MAG TPA: hypothetical protein VLA77_01565 [Candidatus Saccharimonadales bacterium]|nr:hypothetical protein [Candidatus Saccharimonadales bacterium]
MHDVLDRVLGVLKFFSVGILITSLFAPFRQISAGQVRGNIKTRLIAWADRQFSRIIGAIVRLIIITIGLILATIVGVFGVLLIVIWPFLPVAPLIGIFLMQSGITK